MYQFKWTVTRESVHTGLVEGDVGGAGRGKMDGLSVPFRLQVLKVKSDFSPLSRGQNWLKLCSQLYLVCPNESLRVSAPEVNGLGNDCGTARKNTVKCDL